MSVACVGCLCGCFVCGLLVFVWVACVAWTCGLGCLCVAELLCMHIYVCPFLKV